MKTIDLKNEINKLHDSLSEINLSILRLKKYENILDKLETKYNNIKIYDDYNLYADLTNFKDKEIFFVSKGDYLSYYINLEDKEFNVNVYNINTINNKTLIYSNVQHYEYYEDSNNCVTNYVSYYEYTIFLKEDLEKLSKQFKDSDKILNDLKLKILKFINDKPSDCSLCFEYEFDSNRKIVKSIEENLIFT